MPERDRPGGEPEMPSNPLRLAMAPAIALLGALLATAGSSGCATDGFFRESSRLTASQVVEMSQAGASSAEIIDQMEASGTVYRLNAAQLVRLHEQGVPDPVLNYMQETYLEDVRARQRLEDMSFWSDCLNDRW
jgi:hypothetical protein